MNLGDNLKLYAGADEIIRNVRCKSIGIVIDDKLCRLDHINSINIKLSRSLYILNSVKNMLLNFILRQIYYTMVQPYLTYGIILWGSTYQSYLKRTVILHKKAIRYMHKAHYNAHTRPLFYASNVLNINNTYRLEVAKFMYDFTRRKLPTPILDFLQATWLFINTIRDTYLILTSPLFIILQQTSLYYIGVPGFGPTFLSL